jgi:oligopeptide transport system substrate-binding protein
VIRSTSFLLAAALVAAPACAPRSDSDAVPAGADARWFGDVTPPAEDVFSFGNGPEPEKLDPGVMSGQPDGRIARMLFEGLTVPDPRTLEPTPGQAHRWEISPDGRVYTFHLRPGLMWSDGTPLTSRDFLWSWRRVLEPATGSRYASFLFPVVNAEAFNTGELKDVEQVGLAAPDDSTFVVTLSSPTPYFLFSTQYYTCLPVPRHVIEKYGERWATDRHILGNGPFVLDFHRRRDRFELVKNPRYWDAANVRLDRVIAWTVEDINTSVNLYKTGVFDWNPSGYIPAPFIPLMRKYEDFKSGRYQGVYFYSVNVNKKPLDDVRVRQALSFAIDRDRIASGVLKGSRDPWGNFTPSGYPGYTAPPGVSFDPDRARRLLAEAGFEGGKGFPGFDLLFNTSEEHRRIAEAVQEMWRQELGIQVRLSNQEWGSYLQATTSVQYDVARRSWIGDYLDPNTFLSIMVTGDGNNRTGWSDPEYDRLVRAAGAEVDAAARMALLARAEARLLEAAAVIPIYHYSTTELIKPYVRGLYTTALDTHPLKFVWIDRNWRAHADSASAGRTE